MQEWKKVKSLSRVRLCDPMDCSLPGSSVYGIFQARVLEWVTISFSRGWIFPTQGSNLGLPRCRQTLYRQSLGGEDPLEKRMATHSSILGWRIPWTEEPGSVQSMGWQRVGHNWMTNTFTFNWLLVPGKCQALCWRLNKALLRSLRGCSLVDVHEWLCVCT